MSIEDLDVAYTQCSEEVFNLLVPNTVKTDVTKFMDSLDQFIEEKVEMAIERHVESWHRPCC